MTSSLAVPVRLAPCQGGSPLKSAKGDVAKRVFRRSRTQARHNEFSRGAADREAGAGRGRKGKRGVRRTRTQARQNRVKKGGSEQGSCAWKARKRKPVRLRIAQRSGAG